MNMHKQAENYEFSWGEQQHRTAEFRKDKTIRDPGTVARTAARYQAIRKSCHLSLYESRVDSHSGFGANDPAKSVAQLSLESGGDTLSKLAERCANGKNLRSQQRRVEQPQLHLHRHEAYHP